MERGGVVGGYYSEGSHWVTVCDKKKGRIILLGHCFRGQLPKCLEPSPSQG